MRFQGCFLKLSTEIKCFISPISNIEGQKGLLVTCEKQKLIDDMINKYLANSYNNLDVLQQNLIHDSVSQMICKPITKDYSVWVFSILKGLEARIKEIFQHNNITLYEKQGFCIYDRNASSKKYLFTKQNNKFQLDSSIVSINDVNTINVLGKCYDYLNKNRNSLFHTKQIGASRVLNSSNNAEKIIYEVMNLFEESYSKLGY